MFRTRQFAAAHSRGLPTLVDVTPHPWLGTAGVPGRTLDRVDSQNRSHRATIQVAAVHCSADRDTNASRSRPGSGSGRVASGRVITAKPAVTSGAVQHRHDDGACQVARTTMDREDTEQARRHRPRFGCPHSAGRAWSPKPVIGLHRSVPQSSMVPDLARTGWG